MKAGFVKENPFEDLKGGENRPTNCVKNTSNESGLCRFWNVSTR